MRPPAPPRAKNDVVKDDKGEGRLRGAPFAWVRRG